LSEVSGIMKDLAYPDFWSFYSDICVIKV